MKWCSLTWLAVSGWSRPPPLAIFPRLCKPAYRVGTCRGRDGTDRFSGRRTVFDHTLDLPSGFRPIRIAQATLEDLAGILARQVAAGLDVLRYLVTCKHLAELRADRRNIERDVRLRF